MKTLSHGMLLAAVLFSCLCPQTARAEAKGLLYVAHTAPRTVNVYDVELMKRVGSIPAGGGPLNVAMSPDGKLLAVSHAEGSGDRADVLWIIDRETNKVQHTVEIYKTRYRQRGDSFLLFSMDGEKLYAVESDTGFLNVVRTSDWRLVKKVALGTNPRGPVPSPDGKTLYVPGIYSRKVFIVDAENDAVRDALTIDGLPSAVAVSPDGKTLYVTDMENHRVLFIDLTTRAVTKEISVGSAPGNLLLTGGILYVLNAHSNSLSVIDVKKQENMKSVGIGILPRDMAFDPAGKRLYVVSTHGSIVALDTVRQEVIRGRGIPTDITPAGIVFAPR